MARNILQKSLLTLLKQQTNILTAAFVIMVTVILSQILGLIRQRLLVAIFGASNTLGVFLASDKLPNLVFQSIIAAALASAFIPVFSDYLSHGKEKEGQAMASTLLLLGLFIFAVISIVFAIFAPFFLGILNPGNGFTAGQMVLMANLMRIIIFGQFLFIVGIFFTALLQSYNHFFIPGFALALYNLGIIIAILVLHAFIGIYAAAYGVVLGSILFIFIQLPLVKKVGFTFKPSITWRTPGVLAVARLMWPRTISMAIFQGSSIITVALISFLQNPGRNYVIFDYAQTLAFAPVGLFGQTIAQAAFPVLSRERNNLENFKITFITSFNQMLYLVLPFSVLFLVLRIPLVRLIYGASQFDWQATVLTGRTLAFFSLSIFAQALIYLVSRGFYALHDTMTPLIIGAITTIIMIALGGVAILVYHFGIESIAFSYSLGSVLNLLILLIILDRKVGGFQKTTLFPSMAKIFLATIFTAFALYIPIKLLDQLVFDTTKTINLLILTGISSFVGLSLYLFLTWLLSVREAVSFILLFRKVGNWRDILQKSEESIDGTRVTP